MSIKPDVKKMIMQYMLQHIYLDDKSFIEKTISTFKISRTSVYNYLKQLTEDFYIEKDAQRACRYSLVDETYSFVYQTKEHLEEDRIFKHDIQPLIGHLPQNVFEILRYIFTEMMNNAIEHANATSIKTMLLVNKLNVRMLIIDDGIGIFKKIQQFFAEQGEDLSLDEAVDALFPGKLTTAKKNHTGEGIFFSSRAADQFVIFSENKCFRHDSFSDIKFELKNILYTSGTCVAFSMNNNSTKQLKDVFDMFSDAERGFFKTQIPIAHMFESGCPVSRSEARRLGSYVKRFEEVTLDFKDVTSIGQAFTHELFIVFQNDNPNMKFNVVNANTDVANMISRVKNTK